MEKNKFSKKLPRIPVLFLRNCHYNTQNRNKTPLFPKISYTPRKKNVYYKISIAPKRSSLPFQAGQVNLQKPAAGIFSGRIFSQIFSISFYDFTAFTIWNIDDHFAEVNKLVG